MECVDGVRDFVHDNQGVIKVLPAEKENRSPISVNLGLMSHDILYTFNFTLRWDDKKRGGGERGLLCQLCQAEDALKRIL